MGSLWDTPAEDGRGFSFFGRGRRRLSVGTPGRSVNAVDPVSAQSYLLSFRCANTATTPKGGVIVEFSMVEPESRIELLTYSLRVI